LTIAKNHPILGVGAGNFEVALGEARVTSLVRPDISAHNLYVEALAETGILGFAALIWFFWLITKSILNIKPDIRNPQKRMYRLGLLGAWISMIVFFFMHSSLLTIIPWLMWGIMLAAPRVLQRDGVSEQDAQINH
jgi:O-antigen ligase